MLKRFPLVLAISLVVNIWGWSVSAQPNNSKDDWLYLDTDFQNNFLYIDKTASRFGEGRSSVDYKWLLITTKAAPNQIASMIFVMKGACNQPKIEVSEIYYFDKDNQLLAKLTPRYISASRKRTLENTAPNSMSFKLLRKACDLSK